MSVIYYTDCVKGILLIHSELNFGEWFIGLNEIKELDSLWIQKLLRLQLPEDLEEEVLVLDIRSKVVFQKKYQLVDVE